MGRSNHPSAGLAWPKAAPAAARAPVCIIQSRRLISIVDQLPIFSLNRLWSGRTTAAAQQCCRAATLSTAFHKYSFVFSGKRSLTGAAPIRGAPVSKRFPMRHRTSEREYLARPFHLRRWSGVRRSISPRAESFGRARSASACWGAYAGAGTRELNQKLLAGETAPGAGAAQPPYTTRAISARFSAADMPLRNSRELNQAFL